MGILDPVDEACSAADWKKLFLWDEVLVLIVLVCIIYISIYFNFGTVFVLSFTCMIFFCRVVGGSLRTGISLPTTALSCASDK